MHLLNMTAPSKCSLSFMQSSFAAAALCVIVVVVVVADAALVVVVVAVVVAAVTNQGTAACKLIYNTSKATG
jgi:hypothetical protein